MASFKRSTLLPGGLAGGDRAAAEAADQEIVLRSLAALCTGPVHTLSLQLSLRRGAAAGSAGGGDLLRLSAAGPLIVSAWGASLVFLNLGATAITSPEELRALLAGCPHLVRLDMGGVRLRGEAKRAPGRLFSSVEPHAALRSVVLPPAPWQATPPARRPSR